MIKYRTTPGRIVACEVVRETDTCVVRKLHNGKSVTEAKRSQFQNWHDTWADAKAFLVMQAEEEVTLCQEILARAKVKLKKMQNMEKETA